MNLIRTTKSIVQQKITNRTQEKAQKTPPATQVGRFVGILLALSFIISSCTSYQHPDLEIRQLGFQLTPAEDARLDTANTFAILKTIKGTKHRLDSLLTWTDMLKDHDEERALIYANEAYRLATEKNYRLSRAIAMSYRALLKGRGGILGEGVEDALADAIISQGLIKGSDPANWKVQVFGILGHTYDKTFKESLRDSAIHFELRALEIANNARMAPGQVEYQRGLILLDLANIYAYSKEDNQKAIGYFRESVDNAVLAENDYLLLRVWKDMAVFYSRKEQDAKVDSAFRKSIEYGESVGDKKGLISIYQRLGNWERSRFVKGGMDSSLIKSYQYLRKCLDIQMESSIKSNLYYTYLLIAYNYNVQFEKDSNLVDARLEVLADSAVHYYMLAMEEAGKEGVLRIMPSSVKNISKLCSAKKRLLGKDCEDLVIKTKDDYYFKFINENYSALVTSVTDGLANSNERIRKFEQGQATAVNSYRLRRNGAISAVGLLIAGLVFLILLQIQQKKRLQSRMEALRAQINPHFMSNSLNAIENLVNRNENEAASKYLIHFSRLSRKILNSSVNSSVSLAEELKTLEHFLALEGLRFKDKLRYKIVVDENLDAKRLRVPSLILQPYVENAILHGIKPKATPSILHITAERKGSELICTVEDDGVGRKKAEELKEKSILVKDQSQGMKITEERLQKIGKVKGSKVEIIDLYDDEGLACGTKVIIRMPLKEM